MRLPRCSAISRSWTRTSTLNERKPLYKFKVPGSAIHLQPIAITPLSAGASQVVLTRARLKYGVKPEEAETMAAQLRAVEAQFPGDVLVETTLGQAELDASHPKAAEAAADRALKSNPQCTDALVLKGLALSERADAIEDDSRHAVFEQARQSFVAANKLDTEFPEPLFEFYRTFAAKGSVRTPMRSRRFTMRPTLRLRTSAFG